MIMRLSDLVMYFQVSPCAYYFKCELQYKVDEHCCIVYSIITHNTDPVFPS